MTLKIITDSAADLPQELVQKYDLDILPFLIVIDGQQYLDGRTISPAQVYEAIRQGQVPTTSQVPPPLLYKTFKRYASQERPCLYLAFSSQLSGTCNTARLVAADVQKEYPDCQLTICDTKSGSLGQGLIVLEAAKMLQEGAGVPEIIQRVQLRSQNNVEHVFSVDNLNYLYRGGRVSYANAFLGSILNVKPILQVKDGLMMPIQRVRGKGGAVKRIVELIKERSLGNLEQIIAISHADDLATAQKLQELIASLLGYKNFLVNIVGSVLGCHIGLGGAAAFFVNSRVEVPNLP